MAMDRHERAQVAARALHAQRSPEERAIRSAHVYLAGAVGSVCKRWAELTPEQQAAVRTVACS